MIRETYLAPAIRCEGCANSIKRSLGKLSGVETVEVDAEAKRITVQYDSEKTDSAAIRMRLEQAGFPAAPVNA
jgi:copper chaperone CopZ